MTEEKKIRTLTVLVDRENACENYYLDGQFVNQIGYGESADNLLNLLAKEFGFNYSWGHLKYEIEGSVDDSTVERDIDGSLIYAVKHD